MIDEANTQIVLNSEGIPPNNETPNSGGSYKKVLNSLEFPKLYDLIKNNLESFRH